MKKVISFCLWGDNPIYNTGAIRNTELAKEIYPEFECWFYIHKESVLKETINKLLTFDNTKIIFKEGDLNHCKPMMWRFLAIDEPDVEIMLSRDTDSRLYLREKIAVDEWLLSDKLFHIMRDHPYHATKILGGMFCTKKIPQIKSWKNIMDLFNQSGHRDYDQTFLSEYIYPIIVNNSMIHASFHRWESHSKNFPIAFDNEYKFVGEYIFIDESCCQEHRNMIKDIYGFGGKK